MESENKNILEISDIFNNHIKVEPKVMAIETLFNNNRRFNKTNYTPSYQRNYVWDDEKASYFIESILLGTEIPPLIFFNSGEFIEVIDGRQRYETIYRFVNNIFKLKSGGLLKLKDLANKNFNGLNELKDTIWDTKLRIIEFSFHSKPETEYDLEDIVKKEIFKRYNSGITPLKITEIDKAKYIEDDLNSYFKKKLKDDKILFSFILKIFYFENDNIEKLLKKIRELLVLQNIPISYYANRKERVINKFYEFLSINTAGDEVAELFNNFLTKVSYLHDIKSLLEKRKIITNRVIFECIFWAIAVLENENNSLEKINTDKFKNDLVEHIINNLSIFRLDRSSFAQFITDRYKVVAEFFEKNLGVAYKDYLRNQEVFKSTNKGLSKQKTDTDALAKFESLRLNKPDASSNAIDDISRQMTRQRFMIRPVYQRTEVINKNKSSAIIESILLGIKLPPIFVYKRKDGVSEVVDGQQRLLSILGFIGKEYLDENKKLFKSEKNEFSLNLKNGILKELHGKKFSTLPQRLKDKILDYDLWIIEINYKNNQYFDPVDLFIRLNYKPYPIKDNSFEMWNSYVDRRIINSIKQIDKTHGYWFYLRKNNSRMDNEGLLTSLIYLQYKFSISNKKLQDITSYIDIYRVGEKINIRIKSKSDITKVLDSPELTSEFLLQCKELENQFLKKVESLIVDNSTITNKVKNERLDSLFNIEGAIRTNQNFYALWVILINIPIEKIVEHKSMIKDEIKSVFNIMNNIDSKEQFENLIKSIWGKYK